MPFAGADRLPNRVPDMSSADQGPPSRSEIEAAAERIASVVRRTPVFTAPGGGDAPTIHLKLEMLQHSGSFKARGAGNALLAAPVPEAGIVAASGGNHGAAIAWACRRLGHRATIFVPTISAEAKVERLRAYGADVRVEGAVYAEALAASAEFQAATGARSVHAYDDRLVMAGAGTLARELEHQLTDAGQRVDHIVIACGGGGLSGGAAAWFGSAITPRLWVVETGTTATFAAARAAGEPVGVEVSGLCADSLGATSLGTLAYRALSNNGAESILVDDGSVRRAQRWLWDEFRLVTEPAAATTVAALHSGRIPVTPGESVALVLCGANTATPL